MNNGNARVTALTAFGLSVVHGDRQRAQAQSPFRRHRIGQAPEPWFRPDVLQRVPGTMVFLGARPPEEDPATAPGNHSNKVVFHEPALAVGAAMYAAIALRHLAGEVRSGQ